MNHFAGLSSAKSIKEKFNQLALNHHPDKGGDPITFTKILAEYKAALKPYEERSAPLLAKPVEIKRANQGQHTTMIVRQRKAEKPYPVPLRHDGTIHFWARLKMERIDRAFKLLAPHGIFPDRFTKGWEGTTFWMKGETTKAEAFYMQRFGYVYFPNYERWQLDLD